jgi:alkyl hydroperoxide reductase subunit AhpF
MEYENSEKKNQTIDLKKKEKEQELIDLKTEVANKAKKMILEQMYESRDISTEIFNKYNNNFGFHFVDRTVFAFLKEKVLALVRFQR